jgi:hypothetical protein
MVTVEKRIPSKEGHSMGRPTVKNPLREILSPGIIAQGSFNPAFRFPVFTRSILSISP